VTKTIPSKVMVFDSLADMMFGVTSDTELQWWWCSFADDARPAGTQFLGVAIVKAANVGHASSVAWRAGCNPGGQLMAVPVPSELGDPPADMDHKLITERERLDALTQEWHGCSVKSLAEHEAEAAS
jgi:hypothetical protein